ncbi:MAG: Fpg/Nei family DNA glycosylase [Chthoniobacterales bacterium]
MPELAEVEFYRRQWDCGLDQRITAVELHPRKRIFRGTNTRALVRHLTGAKLVRSTARGKQMLFEFSGDNWLGLHLGMTGKLSVESPSFRPAKHDHLVLRQTRRSLIFNDARQFGRVRFHHGPLHPDWWPADLPQIGDRAFTRAYLDCFLDRHRRAPIKAVLLLQSGFPGIGNWMADEILWRAKIAPSRQTGALSHSNRAALLRETRFVARESIRTIGAEFSDPPRSWLIHQRWKGAGLCPRHKIKLHRATIGGRTTAWCSKCQPR